MIPVICATVWMTRVCFWVVLMETPALGFLFLDMISEGRLLISTLWLDKRLLAYSFISSNDSSYHVLQWINRCFHLSFLLSEVIGFLTTHFYFTFFISNSTVLKYFQFYRISFLLSIKFLFFRLWEKIVYGERVRSLIYVYLWLFRFYFLGHIIPLFFYTLRSFSYFGDFYFF